MSHPRQHPEYFVPMTKTTPVRPPYEVLSTYDIPLAVRRSPYSEISFDYRILRTYKHIDKYGPNHILPADRHRSHLDLRCASHLPGSGAQRGSKGHEGRICDPTEYSPPVYLPRTFRISLLVSLRLNRSFVLGETYRASIPILRPTAQATD